MFIELKLLYSLNRSTAQHNTTQHNTTQHNTTQPSTAQHSTAQHNTAQHRQLLVGLLYIIVFIGTKIKERTMSII